MALTWSFHGKLRVRFLRVRPLGRWGLAASRPDMRLTVYRSMQGVKVAGGTVATRPARRGISLQKNVGRVTAT